MTSFMDRARQLAEKVQDKAKMAMARTPTEKALAEALSTENWGASSTLLRQLSEATFDWQDHSVVMRAVWKSIRDPRTKNWRVTFKGLTLLDYLIKNGHERVVDEARNNIYLSLIHI